MNLTEAEQASPPLVRPLRTVRRILEQNTEPDPSPTTEGENNVRIRQGTSKDRQVSFSDPDMRHGRKSSSKTFTGYKRHIAVDADVPGLICAATILKGNTCEHDGVDPLLASLHKQEFEIEELHIDRGYLPAEKVRKMHGAGTQVISKPPTPRTSELFGKHDFSIDFAKKEITCPAGVSLPINANTPTIRFPSRTCRSCECAPRCVTKKNIYGRVIRLHPEEQWYRQMTQELSTSSGRKQRRLRIPVEHALARVGAIQGRTTRFRGQKKNQFELERVAVVNNLYVLNKLAALTCWSAL